MGIKERILRIKHLSRIALRMSSNRMQLGRQCFQRCSVWELTLTLTSCIFTRITKKSEYLACSVVWANFKRFTHSKAATSMIASSRTKFYINGSKVRWVYYFSCNRQAVSRLLGLCCRLKTYFIDFRLCYVGCHLKVYINTQNEKACKNFNNEFNYTLVAVGSSRMNQAYNA